jgi:hypothetical protein
MKSQLHETALSAYQTKQHLNKQITFCDVNVVMKEALEVPR